MGGDHGCAASLQVSKPSKRIYTLQRAAQLHCMNAHAHTCMYIVGRDEQCIMLPLMLLLLHCGTHAGIFSKGSHARSKQPQHRLRAPKRQHNIQLSLVGEIHALSVLCAGVQRRCRTHLSWSTCKRGIASPMMSIWRSPCSLTVVLRRLSLPSPTSNTCKL